MDPPANDGPDGSSIRPVLSLLAKFENLNKAGDASTSHPPPRAVSPAPKPEWLRDANANPPAPSATAQAREPPTIPKTKSRDKPNLASLYPRSTNNSGANSPTRLGPPPISPRPVHPPSLLVEPPQSPPKGALDFVVGDRPGFLNTDSLIKSMSSPAASPRQFKIPSRPHTPVFEPRRSPRLAASQPPSPPPPRRSGELRRDREVRDLIRPLPPPVNRTEKPLIPSRRSSYIADMSQAFDFRSQSGDKVSPFHSPPSSNGTPEEEEAPPMLPTRPKLQPQPLQRAKTMQLGPIGAGPIGFEPPPVHHSLVNKRRERDEMNGTTRSPITPQLTGEQRPALPARPQTTIESPRSLEISILSPPPRPPRPGANANINETNSVAAASQKRVVSTPTAAQVYQVPPPHIKTHGRSMTVDRYPNKAPGEFRSTAAPVMAAAEKRLTEAPTEDQAKADGSPPLSTTAYPDASSTNRSKPYIGKGVHEIQTKYDSRVFDVCGELVCTTGLYTRVWSFLDGELLMSLAMGEGQRGTSVAFKPGPNVNEEGRRVWVGNNYGELLEADVIRQNISCTRPNAHGRYEIIRIYRHFNELWSLDESGTLHVWGPDESGVPTLVNGPTQSYRVPKGHMFSIVVGDELWHATGKEIRVFLPTLDGRTQFQVLIRPLCQDGAGEVTSGTTITSEPDKVFFGHNDGKVSIYSRSDYSCLGVMNISQYKINSLIGVGQYMWAGYNTGKIAVYDMGQTPWAVKKDWQAHDNPVVRLIADRASLYKLNRFQVVSLGADNMLRNWDGQLQDDWLEGEMKRKDAEYCDFQKLNVLVLTWNAGASTPNSLRYSDSDAAFFQNLLQSSDSPDIIIFGFQELVDLEDKTATAKRFLKPKKKEGSDQERMSHQYRDWRDFLVRCLDDYMSGDLYHLLHTAPLVGLFTCIFVKADLRDRVSNLSSAEVKRGMGGLHGNKGAIIVRFMLDDTSLCFVNCHLAAGQSGANQRHNDIAAILESSAFPAERDLTVRMDSYAGGGDGTLILDHELCLVNGDLNYRIDTMSRDTVVSAVKAGNLSKLLDRDQLLVARRRNPGFRLRAFEEFPITFAPTYKYDVGTDNYDSSEKKRSPAWCDRILYRARAGRIEQLNYRRHEVRVSDHRPVSGRFWFTVKRINPKRRAVAWMECQQRWEDLRSQEAVGEKIFYLTQTIGYDAPTATKLINERSSRRDHRSPSRNKD
ncbi:Endonuclease/exonuclease/phosphatase [Lasiosphaeria miniovina]|uniref:Endonuclease/exonuclease/phosphatase n=1 Tax=Lasiosphaeria miniovina TaxID=1954250 RepID=A0AA40E434_9PEZI|nr:Endonuclease/exonuclease/phosphatase [Lasiosphaeria miniovina]KAK0727324.1 Endonuclease/exonuclease/phosphatase [Lasiosphaeria miniovina]